MIPIPKSQTRCYTSMLGYSRLVFNLCLLKRIHNAQLGMIAWETHRILTRRQEKKLTNTNQITKIPTNQTILKITYIGYGQTATAREYAYKISKCQHQPYTRYAVEAKLDCRHTIHGFEPGTDSFHCKLLIQRKQKYAIYSNNYITDIMISLETK